MTCCARDRIPGLRLLLAAAVLVLWLAVWLGLCGRAEATVPSGNLLQNPDAEAGGCSSTSGPPVSIPGWTTTGPFTVVCYAAGISQTSASGAQIGGGAAYFMGGDQAATSASQTVDVSQAAAEIDGGGVQAVLSGDIGGFDVQDDNMTITATFLDGSGNPVGSPMQIGPVMASDRSSQTELLPRSTSGVTVPAGTRSIAVTMTANRVAGSDNDAAADNLSLILVNIAPPAGTLPAANVGSRSATLNGVVNPAGVTTSAAFEVGPTTAYEMGKWGGQVVGSDTSDHTVQYTLNQLQPGTTYHYRIDATSTRGTRLGNDVTFTTSPVAPVEGADACTDTTSTSVTYQFYLNPGGDRTEIYVNNQFSGIVGSAGDNSLEKVDVPVTGLTPYTNNQIRLMAQNAAGQITWTGACFTPDRPAVQAGPADGITSSATVVHAVVTPKLSATQVHVEYGPTQAYGHSTATVAYGATSAVYAFSQTLTGLSAGTTYHYRIVAVNGVGTTATSDQTFTTSGVAASGGLVLAAGARTSQVLRCLVPRTCVGRLQLVSLGALPARAGAHAVVLAAAGFRIRARHSARVRLHLSGRAQRVLRRHRRLQAMEVMTTQLGGGHVSVSRRVVTLRGRGR